MSLIMVFALVLLAPLSLMAALRFHKLAPTTRNRGLAVSFLLIALAVVLGAAALVPEARMLDTLAEADRDQVRLDARLAEVREMSKVLGGPQAYIEYLKATKAD